MRIRLRRIGRPSRRNGARRSEPKSVCAQGAKIYSDGQTRDFPLHAWRAVARGHLRSQAASATRRRQTAAGQLWREDRSERQTLSIAVRSEKERAEWNRDHG